MSRMPIMYLVFFTGLAVILNQPTWAQRGGRGAGANSVNEPFVGVTNNGKVQPGLFKIASTGVSTEPVVAAAKSFLDGLTEDQRKKSMFAIDDVEWRRWDNVHRAQRQGVSFLDMTPKQRDLAIELMRASLSARGLETTRDVMRLNETIAELTNRRDEYGEHLYWITVMGTPSNTEPWGWQLDGHHADINYFVLGDQVVMSPVFMGSEPVKAVSGKYAGTSVLQEEQDQGLAFAQSLVPDQVAKAVIRGDKPGSSSLGQAYQDNLKLDYAGLKATDLKADQRNALLKIIGLYIGNIRDGHAAIKMTEVKEHLDETYFAWIGPIQNDAVFYYRIHSPVILIEFDHQGPVALGSRGAGPSRQHIHSVVRTPNGNDYGKDLLRQHYEQHANGKDHVHK